MTSDDIMPVKLGRLSSLSVLFGIATDPIATMSQLHASRGPFVILQYPHSRASRPKILVCIADSKLYRTVASSSDVWRTVNVGMRAFKNHAASRLSLSVTRLQGVRHTHYRRMLAVPLSPPSVAAMSKTMAIKAKRTAETWPRHQPIDFIPLTGSLMQDLATELLFGDDRERALPVARMISYAVAAAWPMPGPAYFRWLRMAPQLESAINEWAEQKRGELNPKDLFSVLVNSLDEWGNPPSQDVISGILVFTFGAAYETCQNALLWTLVLLTQYPDVTARLTREIEQAIDGSSPSIDKIGALPLLDAVTKEAMRLFPPVPLQFRRSLVESHLGSTKIPTGTRVLTSIFLINRDPELYDQPAQFKPERWTDVRRSPFEYPVFGAGGRMCPGSMFGLQMFKTALGAILSTHKIELPSRTQIDHRSAITLTPSPAVPLVLREKGESVLPSAVTGSINNLVDLSSVNSSGQ